MSNVIERRGIQWCAYFDSRNRTPYDDQPIRLVTSQPRGFGWDVGSSYAGQRGHVFPKEGFGHTGWTGTSVWVDPGSQTFVIVLTNSRHPNNGGSVLRMRSKVADIVATSLLSQDTSQSK